MSDSVQPHRQQPTWLPHPWDFPGKSTGVGCHCLLREKHLLLLYWLCQSLWLCGSQQLWKILKEMEIPDHLTCLLRNLYTGQEATVRTGHGTTEWFQMGKRVHQGCILSPCLFNFYAEYIREMLVWMKHKLESRLLGEISITSDDTTVMAESEKEIKSLLMKVKEEKWKSWLNFQKTKIMASLHGK